MKHQWVLSALIVTGYVFGGVIVAQEVIEVETPAPAGEEVAVNPSVVPEWETTTALLTEEETARLAVLSEGILMLARGGQILGMQWRGRDLSREAALAAMVVEQAVILRKLDARLWEAGE